MGMAPRTRRSHGEGVQLGLSLFVLLLASHACRGRAARASLDASGRRPHGAGIIGGATDDEHGTTAAAAAPVAPDHGDTPHDSQERRSGEAAGVGVLDFSYGQMIREEALAQHDNDGGERRQQQQQQGRQAVDLRACALGDSGVAEVAKSPWVRGAAAARVLSLRENQVRRGIMLFLPLRRRYTWILEHAPSVSVSCCCE